MNMLSKAAYLAILTFVLTISDRVRSTEDFKIKRQLLFPAPSSKVQWVFGLGLPMPVDSKKVNFGLALKLNYYNLPINISDLVFPYSEIKDKRSKDIYPGEEEDFNEQNRHRWDLYEGLSIAVERLLGSPSSGKDCVLRAICESAANPFFSEYHGGLAAELFHLIFTPSTATYDASLERSAIPMQYLRAENMGRNGEDCKSSFSRCTTSLLGLISFLKSL